MGAQRVEFDLESCRSAVGTSHLFDISVRISVADPLDPSASPIGPKTKHRRLAPLYARGNARQLRSPLSVHPKGSVATSFGFQAARVTPDRRKDPADGLPACPNPLPRCCHDLREQVVLSQNQRDDPPVEPSDIAAR